MCDSVFIKQTQGEIHLQFKTNGLNDTSFPCCTFIGHLNAESFLIVFAGCRVNTFKDSGRFGINGLITENTKENHNQNIQLRLIYIKTVNILYKIKIFKQYKAVREINFRKRTD